MPASEYTPVSSDVARWLKDRLTTGGGNRVTDFSASTVPTADEVTAIIADAVDLTAVQIGDDVPSGRAQTAAKKLVAIEAAIQIEISFYAKQLGTQKLEELRATRDALRKIVDDEADKARAAAGDASEDVGESAAFPMSSFSQNAGGLVGYDTEF